MKTLVLSFGQALGAVVYYVVYFAIIYWALNYVIGKHIVEFGFYQSKAAWYASPYFQCAKAIYMDIAVAVTIMGGIFSFIRGIIENGRND